MNEPLMENISDGRIENGFILASRPGRSDPGQGGSGSASTDAPHTRSGTKLWEALPDPTDLILAVAFDGADPGGVGDSSSCAAGRNPTPQRTHIRRKSSMTILVTGGTGLVGSRL